MAMLSYSGHEARLVECQIDGEWFVYSACSSNREACPKRTDKTYIGYTNIYRVSGGEAQASKDFKHHWKW